MNKFAAIPASHMDDAKLRHIIINETYDRPLAEQRAQFAADAYGESYVVVELRPVKTYRAGRKTK